MGNGVRGDGGGVHKEWQQQYVGQGADLHRLVKKNDTKIKQNPARQKDALEKAIEADTKGLTTIEGNPRAQFRNKPLSLKSNNPVLYQPNARESNPPNGAGGTGNPFFAINPMATFFSQFLKMIQMQKQMQLATNKLAITDAKLILGLAKDQAEAIRQEAKAQSDSLIKQATMSFVQAGVSGAMMIATIAGGFFAMKEAREARNAKAMEVQNAKKDLDKVEDSNGISKLSKKEGQVVAKQKNLDHFKSSAHSRNKIDTGLDENEAAKLQHKAERDFAQDASEGQLKMVHDGQMASGSKRSKQIAKDRDLAKQRLKDTKEQIAEGEKEINKINEELGKGGLTEAMKSSKLKQKQTTEDSLDNLRAKEKDLKKETAELDELAASEIKMNNLDKDLNKYQAKNEVAEKRLKVAEDKMNEIDGQLDGLRKSVNPDQNEIKKLEGQRRSWESARNEQKNIIAKKDAYVKSQCDEMEADLATSKNELDKLKEDFYNNKDVQKAKGKYEKALSDLQNFDRSEVSRSIQNLQGKPWYMAMKAGQESIHQGLDGGSKRFQAEGQVNAADWEAHKTMLSARQQILQAAMTAMTESMRDSYQQANDLAQTLIKMSDQEAQSMHWAA